MGKNGGNGLILHSLSVPPPELTAEHAGGLVRASQSRGRLALRSTRAALFPHQALHSIERPQVPTAAGLGKPWFPASRVAPIHQGEHTDEPENPNPTSPPADAGSVA
jgi:hypothetical protein